MRSFSIASGELKRLVSARPFRIAVGVICLVPLLYGVLYLWAFWDPYQRLDKLPVAVVNIDRPVVAAGQTLHVGADLVRQLKASKSFDWRIVSADQARAGLRDGRYYMALTIPADFSKRLGSAQGTSPSAGTLTVQAEEAHNLLATQIGGRVFLEIRSSLAAATSQRYLSHIFVGLDTVKGGLTKGGNGARRLTGALRQATAGSSRLGTGLSTATRGSRTLSSGLSSLAGGSRKLAGGAGSLSTAAGRLAAGLGSAAAGAQKVSAGSRALASGSGSLAGGLGKLTAGTTSLHAGAATLAGGAGQIHAGLTTAAGQTEAAATSAAALHSAAGQVSQALTAYIAAHPDAPDVAELQAALSGSGQVADGLGQLAGGLASLGTAASQASAGAQAVASGAASLAQGAGALRSGVQQTRTGAGALAKGARTLAGGASVLATGSAQAKSGSGALVTGLDRLEAGGSALHKGLTKASAGGSRLTRSLRRGAATIPTYSAAQRTRHAAVMSDPVKLTTQRLDPVPNYGTGFAPYFIPLALWVGALMTYFIARPLSGRALASTLSDADVAFAGLWPGAVVTSLQAVVLVAVLELTLGLHPVEPLALLGFALVSAFAFTAILQFLSAALGTAGKFVAIVLLMAQLTSSAGTFPLQTVPRFFQLINPWLPMTYVVSGLRQAISGGDLRALAMDTLVLLGFAGLGVVGTILTAHRRRMWTMDRLKPVVTMQ
jgi:putative membrane protein